MPMLRGLEKSGRRGSFDLALRCRAPLIGRDVLVACLLEVCWRRPAWPLTMCFIHW